MTADLNEKYGVTISQASASPGHYVAVGSIFNRITHEDVRDDVRGEGRTWASASDRALAEAERIVALMLD